MPIFSVVIAVYNGALTLPKTLACLLEQSLKNFEIILVNDESTDESEKIILDFTKKHQGLSLKYIAQKNRGLGGARNIGMKAASGRFISLLDQDDIWYPEKLAKMAEVFEKHPEISFASHLFYHRINGELKGVVYSDTVDENLFNKLLFDTNFLCGSAMSFRQNVLDDIGYFSEERNGLHLTEDYDYWLRAAAHGLKFFVLGEVLGEYIVHQKNFSKNKLLMFRNEWNVVWQNYKQRPVKQWSDPLKLAKRRGKILARQALALMHMI